MTQDKLCILLVEDSPDDADIIREALGGIKRFRARLHVENTLADGLDILGREEFDLVLLDLNLPDSTGVETLERFLAASGGTPVIVVTGTGDDTMGVKAVQMGAQDYLMKQEMQPSLLARSVRYATERQRLLAELTSFRGRKILRDEENSLRRMNEFLNSQVQNLIGSAPLREAAGDRFDEFLARYRDILQRSEERRIYKVSYDITGELRQLAGDLFQVKAGPRDLVEIHSRTMNTLSQRISGQKFDALVDEGRLLLIELMGYLAGLYRIQVLGKPIGSEDGRDAS